VVMELYRPIKPTPDGPSNTARNLVRIMPSKILMTEDPPIRADDFKIWP